MYFTVDTQSSVDSKAAIPDQFTESIDPVTFVVQPILATINAIDADTFAAIVAFNAVVIKTILTVNPVLAINFPTIDSVTGFDARIGD